jgi:hypothetical protein
MSQKIILKPWEVSQFHVTRTATNGALIAIIFYRNGKFDYGVWNPATSHYDEGFGETIEQCVARAEAALVDLGYLLLSDKHQCML